MKYYIKIGSGKRILVIGKHPYKDYFAVLGLGDSLYWLSNFELSTNYTNEN